MFGQQSSFHKRNVARHLQFEGWLRHGQSVSIYLCHLHAALGSRGRWYQSSHSLCEYSETSTTTITKPSESVCGEMNDATH